MRDTWFGLRRRLAAAGAWCRAHPADLLAALSLAEIGAGFWLFHPGLGLIVPGCIVFACLALGRLRG